ncbi:MAG: hypothetical protein AB8G96_02425 [Phycisphaerales bacterium]
MAKGKKNKGRGGGAPVDPAARAAKAAETLAGVIDRIRAAGATDPSAAPIWGEAHKAMLGTPIPPGDAGRIIATRDLDGLERAAALLRGEDVALVEEVPVVDVPEVPLEMRRDALKAFRRRVKLVRLDHESKLGVGPMTGGKKADFDAILPPDDFGREVWDALVAEGSLKSAGQGFYMLAKGS